MCVCVCCVACTVVVTTGLSYVQKAQGEGYVFGRVVLPLVAETNPDEAQYLEDVYSEIPLTYVCSPAEAIMSRRR